MTDINARRTALAAEIDAMKRARGAALADGMKYDGKPLLAAEAELEALDDLEGEMSRRAATEADRLLADARAGKADRFDVVADQWLSKVDEAEAAARAMAAALKDAEAAAAELMTLSRELTGDSQIMLMQSEQRSRRSRSLAALLHTHGGTYQFGELRLPSFLTPAAAPWAESERKTVAALRSQIRGGQNG